MQDQHTQEPWYASKEDGNWRVMAADENGGYTLADVYCDDPEANSRRIVACVNACAGIPTEQLETAGTIAVECQDEMQAELLKAWKQRDDLLAALNFARQGYQASSENGEPDEVEWAEMYLRSIDVAIASVKENK